jgi:hypothetical protein
MNIYHIWAELKSGVSDMEFVKSIHEFLEPLKDKGQFESYRITRRKLGLGMEELLDFHITVEFRDLAQFDQTFGKVAARKEPIESLHHAVNSKVSRVKFALYRDFPDDFREVGEEKF